MDDSSIQPTVPFLDGPISQLPDAPNNSRDYETFKKEQHKPSSALRPEYQAIYKSVVQQRRIIQSKKRHFDATLASMPSPKKAAAKAQMQTEKAEIRQAMILCEEELRKGEELLQDILRVEATVERDFPLTRAAEQEAAQMIAKVNQEIEQARQSLRDMALAMRSETKSRKTIKLEPARDRQPEVLPPEEPDEPIGRLSKPPRFMKPRARKLSKPGAMTSV